MFDKTEELTLVKKHDHTLSSNHTVLHEFEADSYNDSMRKYHELMGFEEYKPMNGIVCKTCEDGTKLYWCKPEVRNPNYSGIFSDDIDNAEYVYFSELEYALIKSASLDII